jgi:hypothetical protein
MLSQLYVAPRPAESEEVKVCTMYCSRNWRVKWKRMTYCTLHYMFLIKKNLHIHQCGIIFQKHYYFFITTLFTYLKDCQYCVSLCITRKEALSTDNIQHSPFITQLSENLQNQSHWVFIINGLCHIYTGTPVCRTLCHSSRYYLLHYERKASRLRH